MGYDDLGLTSGSVGGGASGGAGADATAVLMVVEYMTVESQVFPTTAERVAVYPVAEVGARLGDEWRLGGTVSLEGD